ncbi:uncharacterized protein L203_101197 [Cryptococcus depauperatus CBS 7841]|uniref:Uncharacterized protein n=1 Tax=Cryptococcus depauperatus CBS 7841 TaxID=1295531 RepID=A0A1E3IJZ8_9TREE|nr:hypothetical protein L203_02333 [Cryptococcus depauperatus CBS 7841]
MSLPNAFVTLLTTPSYLPGALVLLHSLRKLHPEPRDFKIVALVTPETVDAKTIGELRNAGYDIVIGVEPIGSGKSGWENLHLMGRPDLNFALTKLHLFRLFPFFSTLIYLDADVLPLRPLSHLFTSTSPHVLSASPDTGWPDCFNSGFMVIRPREEDWNGLRAMLKDSEDDDGIFKEGNGSFDGADQGLLNEWFSEGGGGGAWNRLPFTYNVTPSAAYTYAPAYKRFGSEISNVHFIGPRKPWTNLAGRPAGILQAKGKEDHYDYLSLIDKWYAVYDRYVRPSALNNPDVSKHFAVPETISIWNAPSSKDTPANPTDRLGLAELKTAAQSGILTLKSGQYTSLPLEGRVDLIKPKPKPQVRMSLETVPLVEKPPVLDLPPKQSSPSYASTEAQAEHPAIWDAQRYSPPIDNTPEMSIPHTYYPNAWEASPSQQSNYYSAPRHEHKEPEYPKLPENVKTDDWYARFSHTIPSKQEVVPVFPWEEKEHRPVPQRVFPRGEEPLPVLIQPIRSSAISSKKPALEYQHSSSPSYHKVMPKAFSPPAGTKPLSMVEAMASYTNAWDDIPQIENYVKRISGGVGGRDIRSLYERHHSLQSMPGTPKVPAGSFGFGHQQGSLNKKRPKSKEVTEKGRGRQEALDDSADGDDENSTSTSENEAESGNMLPNIPGNNAQNSFPSGIYAANDRYRDRWAQTDKIKMHDEKVQASEGGPWTSPIIKIVGLPPTAHGVQEHVRGESKTVPFPTGSASSTHGHVHRHHHHHEQHPITSSFSLHKPVLTESLPSYAFDFKSSSHRAHNLAHAQHTSSPTQLVHDRSQIDVGRVWDPNTDVEVRRKDSQKVLSRFMKAAEDMGRLPA